MDQKLRTKKKSVELNNLSTTTENCDFYLPWWGQQEIDFWYSQKIERRVDHMKISFGCFQIRKPMSHTDRAKKVDQKLGSLV